MLSHLPAPLLARILSYFDPGTLITTLRLSSLFDKPLLEDAARQLLLSFGFQRDRLEVLVSASFLERFTRGLESNLGHQRRLDTFRACRRQGYVFGGLAYVFLHCVPGRFNQSALGWQVMLIPHSDATNMSTFSLVRTPDEVVVSFVCLHRGCFEIRAIVTSWPAKGGVCSISISEGIVVLPKETDETDLSSYYIGNHSLHKAQGLPRTGSATSFALPADDLRAQLVWGAFTVSSPGEFRIQVAPGSCYVVRSLTIICVDNPRPEHCADFIPNWSLSLHVAERFDRASHTFADHEDSDDDEDEGGVDYFG